MLACHTLHAQHVFEKAYGSAGDDLLLDLIQRPDSGFALAGYSSGFTNGLRDAYLLRTDKKGGLLWSKLYSGPFANWLTGIIATDDGGYLLSGNYNKSNLDRDMCLIKTDMNGDTLWTRAYGGNNRDECNYALQTSDGGFLLAGFTLSYVFNDQDIYLVKTDSLGMVEWTSTIGDSGKQDVFHVIELDEGYLMAGYAYGIGAGESDMYLARLTGSGDTLWTRTYGTANGDWSAEYILPVAGGYAIVGWAGEHSVNDVDMALLRTDTSGNMLWMKGYGGSDDDRGYNIFQMDDRGYLLSGRTASFGAGNYDVYLVRTDASGDTLWTSTLGGPQFDHAFDAIATVDSGYALAYRTSSYGFGQYSGYMMKILPNGFSGCPIQAAGAEVKTLIPVVGSGGILGSGVSISQPILEVISPNTIVTAICDSLVTKEGIDTTDHITTLSNISISLYPNPTSDKLTIELDQFLSTYSLFLMDLTGKTVLQTHITQNKTTISTTSLSPGMYFYELRDEKGRIATGKVVRE